MKTYKYSRRQITKAWNVDRPDFKEDLLALADKPDQFRDVTKKENIPKVPEKLTAIEITKRDSVGIRLSLENRKKINEIISYLSTEDKKEGE